MAKTLLVIVTGAPGTGKTTVGQRIAEALRLPFVSKDGIKEALFDSLGWKDREWSKRLGAAAIQLMYYVIEAQLRAGRSLIAESNFVPELAARELLDLQRKYPFEPFQILCLTDPAILAQRYKARAGSAERHAGHVDQVLAGEFDADALLSKHGVLEIGGRVLRVDTSDFAAIDYPGLFQAVGSALEGVLMVGTRFPSP